MTAALALGRCSWASCREQATTRASGWDFCATHAAADAAMQSGDDPDPEDLPDDFLAPEATGHGTEAREKQHRRDGEQPCAPCLAAATRAAEDRRRAKMTTALPNSIADVLERASGHPDVKIKRLADKAETAIADLRTALKDYEAKDEIRAEVERLERALAEAKAKLGAKPTAKARPNWSDEQRAAAAERMRQRNLAKQREAS